MLLVVAACLAALPAAGATQGQVQKTWPSGVKQEGLSAVPAAYAAPAARTADPSADNLPERPRPAASSDKTKNKEDAKKKARKLNEKVHETGQKVIFSDGRESTVTVREDMLRKDLKTMAVFLEDGSTVYMTPKQVQRYLRRQEKKEKKESLKQNKKEQKLEKAVKQQIKKQNKTR